MHFGKLLLFQAGFIISIIVFEIQVQVALVNVFNLCVNAFSFWGRSGLVERLPNPVTSWFVITQFWIPKFSNLPVSLFIQNMYQKQCWLLGCLVQVLRNPSENEVNNRKGITPDIEQLIDHISATNLIHHYVAATYCTVGIYNLTSPESLSITLPLQHWAHE